MRKFAVIFLLNGFTSMSYSQNLVPNPSFEDTFPCSSWTGILGPITDWYVPNNSTPDWFGAGSICCFQTPSNLFGFQFPRTGIAYAAAGAYIPLFQPPPISSREYITCHLIQSLQQNKKYCAGFYVSLADRAKFAIDGMGALLTPDTPTCSGSYCFLSYSPQVFNPAGNVLSDTMDWVLISGGFTAAGGEKFITIGNFTPDSDLTIVPTGQSTNLSCGYFIDDVSLEEMQVDTANAGGAKIICEGDSVVLGIPQCGGCLYQWQNVNGSLNDTTLAQPIATPTQTTNYVLMLRDTSTGTICDWTSTDTVTVTVLPAPIYDLANAGSDQTLCKGESVTLGTASCSNCTYQWQPFNNLSNATTAQPAATPTQTNTYILTMTDSVPPCAKTTTDTVSIFVNDCSALEIPNLFTPNGDGKNEVFQIKNLPANSSIQIFNRWGSRVYESSSYNNTWDGGNVPDGTYFYLLMLPDKKTEHGFVEIRR